MATGSAHDMGTRRFGRFNWLGLWTLLGTLSTGSHGFFLILSAPVWILTGTVAAVNQSRQPVLTYPRQGWAGWRAYARFPQGLPPGLARAALDPKPER